MWDLPGPGLEPVSPALAGGFLTTVPPGKLQNLHFNKFLRGDSFVASWHCPADWSFMETTAPGNESLLPV